MRKNLVECPSCEGNLRISQYHCPSCGIDINGEFEGCMFCNLNDEDRYFALVFLQTGGNIRDVERVMGISYPTVKAKLAQLLVHLGVHPERNHGHGHGHGQEHGHGKFGERMKERHAVHGEARKMKRELKGRIRAQVHNTLKSSLAGIHIPRLENNECCDAEPAEGTVSDEDISSIIGALKDGNIDVAAALKRLRGEEEIPQETSGPDAEPAKEESSGTDD